MYLYAEQNEGSHAAPAMQRVHIWDVGCFVEVKHSYNPYTHRAQGHLQDSQASVYDFFIFLLRLTHSADDEG